jgi:hypothetical protein
MNNNQSLWLLPVAGSLLLSAAAAVTTQPPPPLERDFLDATNRLTGSVRMGMNIREKFLNPGGSLNSRSLPANGRRAGRGLPYNYDDGYVRRDRSGNAGGQTWFWGYENAVQVNASGPNTIDFHRTTASGLPGAAAGDDTPSIGAEIAYDHQFGVKEDWHHLRYGLEAAINFMPFSLASGGSYNSHLATRTDTYGYTPLTTPPGAPYHGSFGGPGFVLNSSPLNSATSLSAGTANLQGRYDLNANLWGFRLGPYLECPLSEKFSLHLSGGLAVGIVDATANWSESLTPPGGGTPINSGGGGSNAQVLWGYYAGLDATYQLNERWGVDLGVQFQDLGVYGHDFGGRTAQLDLSQSVFLQLGISYRF